MECDANQFAQMYKEIYRDLYRFSLCMMKNVQDAEDAVSEAVISAYENIAKLRKPDAFKSWIFTILANVCKRKLMRLAKEQENCIIDESLISAAEIMPDYGLPLDVRQAFFILSEEEQLIVGLSVFGGYESPKIGEMMKLNPNTVRSKRKRALEKMECVLK